MDEWRGSDDTDRANDHWSKPSCIKRINDGKLISRTFGAQQNEIAFHIKIANRNMLVARQVSERVR